MATIAILAPLDYINVCQVFGDNKKIAIGEVFKFYPSNMHDSIFTKYNQNVNSDNLEQKLQAYTSEVFATLESQYLKYMQNASIVQGVVEEAIVSGKKSISIIVYVIAGIVILGIIFFIYKKIKK